MGSYNLGNVNGGAKLWLSDRDFCHEFVLDEGLVSLGPTSHTDTAFVDCVFFLSETSSHDRARV